MSAITSRIVRLRESLVAKNTSVLLAGQVFSRLLQIFYIAALARYVGTEGVGKISTATALTGLLVFLVGPGLTTLMVRDVAANRKQAPTYLVNTLFIRLVLSIPFVVSVIVIGIAAGYPQDTMYIVFVYIIVYTFDALGQIFSSVFQAFECMEYDAITLVIRDAINISLSLFCIFLRLSLLMICVVTAVAQVSKFILMAGIVHRKLVPLRMKVDLATSKALLVKSLPFSALIVLLAIRFQLGTFILSLFDTANAVGIYSAATTLILMLLMLSGAFSTAVLPAFSRMYEHDRRNLPRFYQLSYKYLMLVGFPIGLATMLFGGRIIVLIYGDEFRDAGAAIAILAVSLFTMMSYSNGPLLNAIGKQRFFAWTQALVILANVIFCLWLIPYWGPNGAALATMLAGLGGFTVHSIACHRQLGLSLPWTTTAKAFLSTFVMGISVLVANMSGMSWWVVALIVMPLAYILPTVLLKLIRTDELRILAGVPMANRGD